MLGRASTWLRIMGYDTVYAREMSHREMVLQAIAEKRVLLTRNTRLIQRRDIRKCEHLFIKDDGFREQLVQIMKKFELKCENNGTRCAKCNTLLEPTSVKSISRIVPAYVAFKQEKFYRCKTCCRVYWPATHKSSINEEIKGILSRAVNLESES